MLRMRKFQFDADCYQKRVPLTFAKVNGIFKPEINAVGLN